MEGGVNCIYIWPKVGECIHEQNCESVKGENCKYEQKWENVEGENYLYEQKWESVWRKNWIYEQRWESVEGRTVSMNKGGKV
jgi:hypothetical protein